MEQLPKTVYVYRMQDGDDYEWLSADESIEATAIKGEIRLVGVYELKEIVEVELEVKERVVQRAHNP